MLRLRYISNVNILWEHRVRSKRETNVGNCHLNVIVLMSFVCLDMSGGGAFEAICEREWLQL
jgi:hypothetical protein